MLQALRQKVSSRPAKVLFLLLVASFAFWGIGDFSFLRRNDPTVIRIDDVKITASRLDSEYRQELDRLRRSFGNIDAETARQFGLVDRVIDRLVAETLINKEIDRFGIIINDDVVRARIVADPTFQGPDRRFDRNQFLRVLYENSLNEQRFVELTRRDIARAALIDAIEMGSRAPKPLIDRIYRYRQERRAGQSVFVAAALIGDVGKPDEAAISALYDGNKDSFTLPEFRALSVVRIGVDEIMPTIVVSDQELNDEFAARINEFRTPERRDIEQVLFQDEAAAKAARDRIVAGASLADVARETGSQAPQQTHLGLVTRDELLPELADPVFALAPGAVSEPLRSAFGWHLVKVLKIEVGKEPTLAEVKDRLTVDVQRRLAGETAYKTANRFDDSIANGAPLAEAAAKSGLSVLKVAAVDARGLDGDGKAEAVFASAPEALTAAFETATGRESPLIETQSGLWFVVRVDSVTPSRLQSLDEVRDRVAVLWQEQKRSEAARARAEAIAARVDKGETLDAAAASFQLKPAAIPASLRPGFGQPQGGTPLEVTGRLFALKVGEAGVAPGREGYHVVRLTEILPADPAADAAGVERVAEQLRRDVAGDLLGEFTEALKRRYGVEIDRAAIDRQL